ncbi:hypothetical protein [Amphibacillus cookii]|uniref:hypothetical protein n=1 Tax=Amphibacillus cookii TaxID=767787 RepID=UPI00195E761F|nr:hypothetical protein [Amphibacillus cookii]MBM7542392.1 hypothetical protein [Amphibacillus cookii]
MSNQYKIGTLIILALVFFACYQDLTKPSHQQNLTSPTTSPLYYDESIESFQVISYQVQRGEQLLSILEAINDAQIQNIDQAIIDFKSLNPTADIYQLEVGHVYLFPRYSNDENNWTYGFSFNL